MQDWTPKELEQQLSAGSKVFLKLWKKGCGACKLSIPAIERLEAANAHGLTFGQISADDHPDILEITDTEVLPAFFVFADGKMVGNLVGFKGLERLKELVESSMQATS